MARMKTHSKLWRAAAILFLAALSARAAQAEILEARRDTPQAKVTLAADGRQIPGWPVRAILRFDLLPAWHVYWRNPGDAGLSPTFDWTGSTNFKRATVHWPTPKRKTFLGFDSFVYDKMVILAIDIEPQKSGAPMDLRLVLDYGICAEICIPERLTFAIKGAGARLMDAKTVGEWPYYDYARESTPLSFADFAAKPRLRVVGDHMEVAVNHNGGDELDLILVEPDDAGQWSASFGRPEYVGRDGRGPYHLYRLPVNAPTPQAARRFLAGLKGQSARLLILIPPDGEAMEGIVTVAR